MFIQNIRLSVVKIFSPNIDKKALKKLFYSSIDKDFVKI